MSFVTVYRSAGPDNDVIICRQNVITVPPRASFHAGLSHDSLSLQTTHSINSIRRRLLWSTHARTRASYALDRSSLRGAPPWRRRSQRKINLNGRIILHSGSSSSSSAASKHSSSAAATIPMTMTVGLVVTADNRVS